MPEMSIHPSFEKRELARLLGGKGPQTFSRSIKVKTEKLGSTLAGLMKPDLYYRFIEIGSIHADSVRLKGGITLVSKKLSKTLSHCEEIVCFVGTIGPRLEDEINRLTQRNRVSQAYILDAMGSTAVESMVDEFQRHMEKALKPVHKGTTLRFSPGYCDWPLTEQKKLFRLFQSRGLNVNLNDSCLMQPRKSISGIFGVFPFQAHSSAAAFNPCSDCGKKGCSMRRSPGPI
jgi:hypothetical protein